MSSADVTFDERRYHAPKTLCNVCFLTNMAVFGSSAGLVQAAVRVAVDGAAAMPQVANVSMRAGAMMSLQLASYEWGLRQSWSPAVAGLGSELLVRGLFWPLRNTVMARGAPVPLLPRPWFALAAGAPARWALYDAVTRAYHERRINAPVTAPFVAQTAVVGAAAGAAGAVAAWFTALPALWVQRWLAEGRHSRLHWRQRLRIPVHGVSQLQWSQMMYWAVAMGVVEGLRLVGGLPTSGEASVRRLHHGAQWLS